uniref:Uncharacterized protein n=1 Tax=viral metagenome TaxID=1070528 RepID=A0A6C0JMX4_9ZZZZ
METKDQLIKTIKEWVKLDNDIRKLQKELAQRKNEKKKLSNSLIDIMKKNEIDCFDINNGQICYNKKNIKKPITKKVLLDTLSKYYKGDLLKATEINNYILENREEITKESIILKPNKIMDNKPN